MNDIPYQVSEGFEILPPPEPVGFWHMPGAFGSVKFGAYKRPRWLTIKMMWLVFEWKWEDKK